MVEQGSPEQTGPATPSRRRYRGQTPEERHADRRSRLMAAGLEAFGTQGYAGTSIEQLCAAAGVATRNFYDEFPSREALLIALHDDINGRAFAAVADALTAAPAGDFGARSEIAFDAYLQVMTGDPRALRIAVVETVGATPAVHAARRATLARFADLIRVEAERLAPKDMLGDRDYSLAAVAVVGGLTAMLETLSAGTNAQGQPLLAGPAQVQRIRTEAVRLLLSLVTGP